MREFLVTWEKGCLLLLHWSQHDVAVIHGSVVALEINRAGCMGSVCMQPVVEALFAYCGMHQPQIDYFVRMNNEFGNFQITVMPTR